MVLLAGCDQPAEQASDGAEPFASRYQPLPSGATLITGATVLTGTGERLDGADVLIRDGKIAEVGTGLSVGVADSVGSLEAGKAADVVIWPGDPLELTNFPDQVFINGEKIPMVSRQTLLRDRYLQSNGPPAYRN
jgi:cytosine/adenosine deaminase-related metal-dependent hydrolase